MTPEEVLKLWEWAKIFDFTRSVMRLCQEYAREMAEKARKEGDINDAYRDYLWQSILNKMKEEG